MTLKMLKADASEVPEVAVVSGHNSCQLSCPGSIVYPPPLNIWNIVDCSVNRQTNNNECQQ